MKRILCFLICLFIFVHSALADSTPALLTEEDPAYEWLYEKSMELAAQFDEVLRGAWDEVYSALMLDEGLASVPMQDYTDPWDVSIVRADQPLSDEANEDAETGSYFAALLQKGVSPALEQTIRESKYHTSTSYLAIAHGGPDIPAISSIFSINAAYIRPECMDSPCYAVLFYGGLYALAATFYPTLNGTVTAIIRLIPSHAADYLNLPAE